MKAYHFNFIFREVNKIPQATPHFYSVFPSMIQDSRAIQYTSEVVSDTVLKYIKSVMICFGWGGSYPQTPQA